MNDKNTTETTKSTSGTTRKSRKKGSGMSSNTLVYLMFILGVSLIISTFVIVTLNDVLALVKSDESIIVQLAEDQTPSQMAKVLKENKVIKYPWAFKFYASLKDYDTYKSGKYELNPSMDYGQINDTLRRVANFQNTVDVTIPEGYTLDQIGKLLEDAMVCSYDDFIETANTYPYKHTYLQDIPMEKNRLEGFLFPDTYQFYVNDKVVNVINKMLNNFGSKITDAMMKNITDSGKTLREVVTMASLVEREAKLGSEQSTIAGVINNRLKNSKDFPYLNIDATIQYAVGHKNALTAEDLKIDSPYNTYTKKGLPPGPICSPGVPAILASISPESHGYYYYVASGDENGSHIFSKTLKEHNAAVEKAAQNAK